MSNKNTCTSNSLSTILKYDIILLAKHLINMMTSRGATVTFISIEYSQNKPHDANKYDDVF